MNYDSRTIKILSLMAEFKADWFFVTSLFNIRYLSGFTGSHGVLLIGREKRYILTDGRYQEQVKNEVSGYEPVIQGNRQELDAIAETVGDLSNQTVWFESDHCTFSRYKGMKSKIPGAKFVAKKDIVESLRKIKDEEEIAEIRRALETAEHALEGVVGQIREGMTERELAHLLEDEMWRNGARKESFETLVLFGRRTSLCHGKPSDNRLQFGEAVLMDFGCILDGYCSDITRMAFLGRPDDDFRNMYAAVLAANRNVEEKIRPGMSGVEADMLARQVTRGAGYEGLFLHSLGHGVGLEIHEYPRLSPIYETALCAGSVVTVEPGLYIPDQGGIRIEDMIVIREDGCEVFNRISKDLILL